MAILVAPQTLHASPVAPTLTVNGSAVVLTPTIVGGVEEFAYSNTSTDILNTQTTDFLATLTNIAGIDVLNVTDVCAQVTIAGPAIACPGLAFSFTDVNGWNGSIVSALGLAGANVYGDVADISFGASVGAGSATVDFAPTPEPESLALLATGLIGVAGVVRRKVSA